MQRKNQPRMAYWRIGVDVKISNLIQLSNFNTLPIMIQPHPTCPTQPFLFSNCPQKYSSFKTRSRKNNMATGAQKLAETQQRLAKTHKNSQTKFYLILFLDNHIIYNAATSSQWYSFFFHFFIFCQIFVSVRVHYI